MKLGLQKTREIILDIIDSGDDLIVNTIKIYDTQIRVPTIKKDTEPHICDFLRAGVNKDIISYYFAYLVVCPGNTVISKKTHKKIDSTDIKTMADDFRIQKIKKEIMPNVLKEKERRKNKEKELKKSREKSKTL